MGIILLKYLNMFGGNIMILVCATTIQREIKVFRAGSKKVKKIDITL